MVGWTDGPDGTVAIPAYRGTFTLYDSSGQSFARTQTNNNAVFMPLRRSPVFMVPDGGNALWNIAAAATRVPPMIEVKGPAVVPLSVTFTNTMDEDFLLSLDNATKMYALRPGQGYEVQKELDMGRQDEPVTVQIGANGFDQWVSVPGR